MKTIPALALAAAIGANAALATPTLAKSDNTFVGTVTHVSANNLKVRDQSGQELGFVLTPHFNAAYKHGKTAQMNFLHPGSPVEVIYDQKALGIRHADKVIMLDRLPAKQKM